METNAKLNFLNNCEKVIENFRGLSTMGLILALLQSLGASAAATGPGQRLTSSMNCALRYVIWQVFNNVQQMMTLRVILLFSDKEGHSFQLGK